MDLAKCLSVGRNCRKLEFPEHTYRRAPGAWQWARLQTEVTPINLARSDSRGRSRTVQHTLRDWPSGRGARSEYILNLVWV